MRQDQERIKNLLIDTVTLLCKNSVQFQDQLHVEGLLGVSVDKKDVFFVHISKEFSNGTTSGDTVTQCVADSQEDSQNTEPVSEPDSVHQEPRSSAENADSVEHNERIRIKTEPQTADQEECLIVEDPKIKLEGRVSSAQVVAGQRRALKRTSTAESQLHSSDSNVSGGYGDGDSYDSVQFGEPSSKRRSHDQGDDSYLQGDSDEHGGTPWPSLAGPLGFDPSQTLQHDSDNSQIDGSQPGCSTWPAGRGVSDSADRRVFRDRLDPLQAFTGPEFLARYGLSKDCVLMLADRIVQAKLAGTTGRSRGASPTLTVCMGIQFLKDGCLYRDIAEVHGVSRATVCRVVTRVVSLLVQLSREYIRFPTSKEHRKEISNAFDEIAGLPGAVGIVDGLHIPIHPPIEDEALYLNSMGAHSINVQVITDHQHRILDVDAHWPGSTNDDDFVWKNSMVGKACEENGLLDSFFLLGDNGYSLQPWLMTPFVNPEGSGQVKYNEAHHSAHRLIQTTIARWKKSFQCLDRMNRWQHTEPNMISRIIVASAVLHNLTLETKVPFNYADIPPDDVPPSNNNRSICQDSSEGIQARLDLVQQYFT